VQPFSAHCVRCEKFRKQVLDMLQSDAGISAVNPAILIAGKGDFLNAYDNRVHLSGITYCRDYGNPQPSRLTLNPSAALRL